VKPEEVVHIGDDRRNDLWGARDAGCDAWLWGSDVYSFKEVYYFFLLLNAPVEFKTVLVVDFCGSGS
jgi:FMN phosphatase YigB (HAD superfamily)